MLACCVLALAVVATVRARWHWLQARWLRLRGRHAEAAALLEEDYDVRNRRAGDAPSSG